MPRRPRSHQLADLSLAPLHSAFEDLGWTVEDLSKDYGEDMLVRLFEGELATPYAFFVQAKAIDNIERYLRPEDDAFSFPIKTGHLRRWVRFSEPVFLTLYDAKRGQTLWSCVQSAAEKIGISSKTYRKATLHITIPRRNPLDADGLLRMRGITRLRFDHRNKERQGARLLIELLETRFDFKVKDYDPIGEFISVESGEQVEFFFLGSYAKRMEGYLKQSGLKREEFIVKAAETFLKKPLTPESRARTRKRMQELEDKKERDAGKLSLLE